MLRVQAEERRLKEDAETRIKLEEERRISELRLIEERRVREDEERLLRIEEERLRFEEQTRSRL